MHLSRGRKGNALLLVSGLLVMLTLIAAAYLSRSRAQRTTAAAIHDTVGDSSRASMIAQQLASDVSQHLFLRPVDPNSVGSGIFGGNSAAARKNPSPYDARYGVEAASTFIGANGRGDMLADSVSPTDPLRVAGAASGEGDGWPDGYNFAPYSVIPWTNWPDHVQPVDLDAGGNPSANRFFPIQPLPDAFPSFATPGTLANNPIGNPGFGDTRWLRSTEPVRMTEWRLLPGANTTPLPTVPDGAFFSHWQHLSFPATANNGWRVVPDVSDIEGHTMAFGETALGKFAPGTTITTGTFVGGAMTGDMSTDRDGLGTPYEQWSAYRRPTPLATIGLTATSNDPSNSSVAKWVSDFAARRNLWFSRTEYLRTMGSGTALVQAGNGSRMLPNLFKLDDPLGLGRAVNPTATPVPPSDEYIENSPRNIVSRTFADADGDGWTDSFWFLAPVGQEKNVRTVVGVSIVDNAGMVDVNVATRADRHTTVGFTPADVALVTSEPEGAYIGSPSEPSELGSAPWTDTRVGLFDSTRNFARGRWSAGDPKVASTNNPSGTRTDLYDATQFEQGFDPYRWAGNPTPMIPGALTNGWSWTSLQEGEQTFLSSLGLWYGPGGTAAPQQNFWNGYLHTPSRSAARDPLDAGTPRIDLVFPSIRDQLNFGPWLASAPPGTGARWQQSEPLYATYVGSGGGPTDLSSWRWESWFDTSFSPGARPPTNAPNVQGAYAGSPFMRPEERTRWFRAAVSGDLIAYGPFSFMGTGHVNGSWRDATRNMRLAASSRDFLGESIPFRPFEPADEIELRAYGGLNDAGAITRLERALNGDSLSRENSSVPDTLLRSSVLAAESGKAGMQLNSAQWVKDLRRKITTISGQRNELMPPHLWTGRNYLALSRAIGNPYEFYQNATLWMDLHPQVPGPIDEDGDGVISSTELRWGAYDLMRVTTSDDPFPDGIKISMTPPVVSPSDWTRGVSLFEYMNRKFDLRQPLLIQRRLSQSDLEQLPSAASGPRPHLNEFGLVDERGYPKLVYAYSVQEQRRAMIDFALNARQRLRPALRTVSPQRQRISPAGGDVWLSSLRDLGPRQANTVVDGVVNLAYASYTDRFLDQLRMTFDARVAGAVEPADRQGMLAADRKGLASLGDLAWRSAWSTEALTASLSANMATWRSRPDLIREVSSATFGRGSSGTPLRPVWQPILPWYESGAAQKQADGNPFVDANGNLKVEGIDFSAVKHRPDYGDSPVPTDVTRRMREYASPQAIRAVDPSRPSKVANAAWGESLVAGNSGSLPNADHPARTDAPSEDSADIVFPGNEKQPFLSECFFGWVYPATTVTKNGVVDLPRSPGRMISSALGTKDTLVSPAPPAILPEDLQSFSPVEQAHLQRTKFVAVVNGQVGRPRLEPDPSDPRNNPILEFFPKRSPIDRDSDPSLSTRNLIPTALAMNWARGLTRLADASSQPPVRQPPARPGAPSIPPVEMRMVAEPDRDGFRDEMNEIRTPVLVVQVANPYSEPLRLADFRLNIFGNLYDFPDYELDANGRVVLDASGEPVPLMLPPATEFQPSTATVYLIADSLGVPKNANWFPNLNTGGSTRASFLLENPFTRIRYERVNQADLSTVAMWDPLFRRRWLDYFDLYEYTDGKHLGRSAVEVQAMQPDTEIRPEPDPCNTSALLPLRHTVWDKSTSPITSCLFSQPTWLDDLATPGSTSLQAAQGEDLRSRLSRSKLLNAMDRSDVVACVASNPLRSAHKHRIDDLWKFKYSLTPDAMRSGIVLERILRDPSGRNADWRLETVGGTTADFDASANLFQTSAISPIECTIDRYRLRFWPLYGSRWSIDPVTRRVQRSTVVFPRDSREPATIFPPRDSVLTAGTTNVVRNSALEANITPIIEPTTLVVDRFDADDDFNHWTTVANGPVNANGRPEAPFEQARTAEVNLPQPGLSPGTSMYQYPLPVDPAATTEATRFAVGVIGTPVARPDDQRARFFENPHLNQDRSLVTGGRFWTACAQITLPPTRHRWPDGRDRRMMGLNDGWAALNGAYGAPGFDSSKYFGAGDGKGDILNPRRDAYWMNWRHMPSLPVMLGATMMTSDTPSPVMVQDLLSRLPSRIVYEGAAIGDPYPVRLVTGDLLTPWPLASYTVEYFVGDANESAAAGNGSWKSEADLFPTWRTTGTSASSPPELLDPSTAWPTVPFDRNVPHGELDASELQSFCRAFPALDRDSNGVPDEMQKIFVGFDEPEGNAASFPPPTALSLIAARSTVPDLTLGMQNNANPYIDLGGGFAFEFGANVDGAAKPGESEVPMLPPVRGLGTSGGFRGSPEYSVEPNGFAGLTEDRRPAFSSWSRWGADLSPTAVTTFNPAAAQTVGSIPSAPNEQEWVPTPEEFNGAHLASENAVDPSFMLPGIVLRTGNESRDYFTTWTRVSRSWARNYHARFATRQASDPAVPASNATEQGRAQQGWDPLIRPGSLLARQKNLDAAFGVISARNATYPGSGDSIQDLAGANLPLWTWERQIITSSTTNTVDPDAFESGRAGVLASETPFDPARLDQDRNVMASQDNLSAAHGAAGPDTLAPRYAFAQRTEPDRCDKPVDMRQNATGGVVNEYTPMTWRGDARPMRQELIGYQASRYQQPTSTTAVPGGNQGQGGSGSSGGVGGSTGSASANPRVWPEELARSGVPIYRAPVWTARNTVSSPYFAYFKDPAQDGRPTSGGLRPNLYMTREVQWTAANNGEFLTAAGDLFAMEPAGSTELWDPDMWQPDPPPGVDGNGTPTAYETDLLWMHRLRKFNWLTSPVIAPLPDMQGLGWAGTSADPVSSLDGNQPLPYNAYPELIMRKPTAFNCQTVVDDRLSRNVPNPPASGSALDVLGNPGNGLQAGYRRFLFAKYGNFLLNGSGFELVDHTTRFVYPPWARPAPRPTERAMSATRPDLSNLPAPLVDVIQGPSGTYRARWVSDGSNYYATGVDLFPFSDTLSLYRVYMGDKGGRLVDHTGKALILDRSTMRPALHNGDVLAATNSPIATMQVNLGLSADGTTIVGGPNQWLMQGVWNTLDRNPHGGSLQMLHKDDDFEQLGELTDVFLWGPAYRVYSNPETTATSGGAEWSSYSVTPPTSTSANGPFVKFDRGASLSRGGWLRPTDLQTTVNYYEQAALNGVAVPRGVNNDGPSLLIPPRLVSQCRATFAEIMTGRVPGFPVGEGPMVNRLQTDPPNIAFHQPETGNPTDPAWGTPIQLGGTSGLRTPYAPNVPWGMRVFDAFTLDGSGGVLRYDWRDQFAGRTVAMNPSSSPVEGVLSLPTSGQTDVRPFEASNGDAGNPNFNPLEQDGAPATTLGFLTGFTAARPAGALIPADAYRDETIRQTTGGVTARNVPVVTRASMAQWEHDRSPSLSGGFQDRPVPGMINVNTASVEVLRALPQMTQLVYDDAGRSRFGGSLDYGLTTYAQGEPFGFSNGKGGLAGSLPAVSGRSVLNTDGQFTNLSTNGNRGANPATRLSESLVIYRDGLNPNVNLAAAAAGTAPSDWFTHDSKDPMQPAEGGTRLSPVTGNAASVPDSFPIYPTYADRGEGAGSVNATGTSPAVVGTGVGNTVTGPRRDPFWFVYFNRGMQSGTGITTPGEILGMARTTRTRRNNTGAPAALPVAAGFTAFPDWQYDVAWSSRLAGLDPYRTEREDPTSGQGYQSFLLSASQQLGSDPLDARLSTDRQGVRTFDYSLADAYNNASGLPTPDGTRDLTVADAFRLEPDTVAGDSEERNMLFKGLSNLVSTRSDVFTAYFRVKTVRQGPDGRWNAMDPETLLSEARYVMCIDRSNVNRPTDKPRIVYFTQVKD